MGKKNLIDNIKIKEDYRPSVVAGFKRVYGKHTVETSFTIEEEFIRPEYRDALYNEMKEIIKARIVGYFYGNILTEIGEIRGIFGRELPHPVYQRLEKLRERIYNGSIIDPKVED